MKDFLIQNWRLILEGCCLIASLVFFLIRKKPVTDIKALLYQLCEVAVIEAEKTGYKGKEKLLYAIGVVNNALASRYPDMDFSRYNDIIVLLIENILSTPHKKEV